MALLEPKGCLQSCLNVDESLVEVQENGSTTMLIVNNSTLPCNLKKNTDVTQTVEAAFNLLHELNGKQELSFEQNVATEQTREEMDSDLPRLFNVSLLPDDSVNPCGIIKMEAE